MNPSLDINLFYTSFTLYFAGFLAFVLYFALRTDIWHKLGAALMAAGILPHTIAFFVRWKIAGYVPLSNMYEYFSVTGWAAALMLLVIYFKYRKPLIGSFIAPLVIMLLIATALLPKQITQSLMPALQSVWLYIHVSLAAIGTGCFLVAFAISMVYLIRHYNSLPEQSQATSKFIRTIQIFTIAFPLITTIILYTIGLHPAAQDSGIGVGGSLGNLGSLFILLGLTSIIGALIAPFAPGKELKKSTGEYGGYLFAVAVSSVLLGGLVAGLMIKNDLLQLTHNIPSAQNGRLIKSAWMIFEFFGVTYLFSLILTLPIASLIKFMSSSKPLRSIDVDLLDDVSYKSISLGYPLYTVGALFAGAVWAEQAWGSFWSWDPKEVGALIIWLFYSGYLHARLQHGWKGTRSAILVIAGFLMVLLSFFGNYFFGGLHAYT